MKRRRFVQMSGGMAAHVLLPASSLVSAGGVRQTRAALIGDEVFLKHHISVDHPESPDRIRAFNQLLAESPVFDELLHIKTISAYQDWLTSVHTAQHIDAIKANIPIPRKSPTFFMA